MGFSLWFGEFSVDSDPEERYVRATAVMPDGVEFPGDAPMGPNLAHGRDCGSGYSSWASFSRDVGLDDSILIQDHPGVVALTPEHLTVLEGLLGIYSAKVGSTPEQAEEQVLASEAKRQALEGAERWMWNYPDVTASDWNLLRLRWLVFWTRWCLDNCDYPTFANS